MVSRSARDQLVSIQSTRSIEPVSPAGPRPTVAQLWAWLEEVPDPEIPAVSVVDLGIVRSVSWSTDDPETALITVTPTYSGCPATDVIGHQIREALLGRGVKRVELHAQLSPAWTTNWLAEHARQKLRVYGIVPPTTEAVATGDAMAASLLTLGHGSEILTSFARAVALKKRDGQPLWVNPLQVAASLP